MMMRESYAANEEIKQLKFELKKKNDLIKEKNHELSSYFFSVSHELKTPINAMSGYLALLRDYSASQFSGDAANYFQRIESNLGRMQQLVDDLVEFSKIQITETEFTEIDFGSLLTEIVLDLQFQVSRKNVRLLFSNNFPVIRCQRILMARVLTNLLSNAIKYSAPNRPPEIEIGYVGDEIFHKFYIKDNGVGIAHIDQTRLFKLFSRIDSRKGTEGSGVGLAITKRIIEGHGGEIWAVSGKNKGAIFFFTLPKTPPAPNKDK